MIKASVLLAFTYGVMFLLRRRPAAERHLLWVMAIGSAALLPLLTLALPSWQPELAARVAGALPEILRTPRSPDAHGQTSVHALGIEPGVSMLTEALPVIWIAGSLVALLVLLLGCGRLKRLASRAQQLSNPPWMEIA